jgi:hypothetical protein
MAKSKICDRCGKPYYRSNRLRLWIGQNPGHRTGWKKDDVKLCTRCMSQSAASQAQRLVQAKIVTISKKAS